MPRKQRQNDARMAEPEAGVSRYPWDAVAKGARVIRLGPEFRWPGRRSVAVVFNVAYEGWSDGKAPGIGPMGNPLPAGAYDTNAVSWSSYGAELGIENLMQALARTRIRASVMTSGVLAQRHPAIVRSIAEAGHEVVAHSWAQDVIPAMLSPDQVRNDIDRTTQALTQAAGVRPHGWISPRGMPSTESARLLLETGYAWHGDAFDDYRPYLQQCGDKRIVAIPLTMEINDLPHAMRFGHSPRQFVERFDDFLRHARNSKKEPMLIDVTAHAHVYGRPSGIWAFEAIARKVKKFSDVWIANRMQIA